MPRSAAAAASPDFGANDLTVERRPSSVRPAPAYIATTDLKFWQKALSDAERELDAATTRTALDVAAKKFMRAKAELKRLQAEVSF